MRGRRPMRLLLQEHGIRGGTETVNIHLVREFTKSVERVVWIVPSWRLKFFQEIIPESDRLVYRSPYSPEQRQLVRLCRKATSFALRQKTLPARFVFESIRRALFNQWLNQIIREHQITHCFCNWTFQVDVPRINVPIGAMLMDVRWKHFPETFPQIDIDAVDQQFCEWLKRSSVIFPISETTAADIRQFYPWYTGNSRVVPHGAETEPSSTSDGTSVSLTERNRCVFFCPAGAFGYKNHIVLFQACAELFRKGLDFDVVLTGYNSQLFGNNGLNDQTEAVEGAIELARGFLSENRNLFQGRIKPLGYLPRLEIDTLYKHCSAVVLPSFFEGFGLALIEALQHGGPVICSDIPAHREQLARYACTDQVALFAPADVVTLATQMERIVTNGTYEPSRQVRANAMKAWTWRDVAEAYVDSLAKLDRETADPHGG